MLAHTLHTPRLNLRPIEPSDLESLVALFGDAEVMRHIGPVRSREESEAWLTRTLAHWQTYGYGNRAVLLRESDAFIGRCGVIWGPHIAEAPELAYTYLPAHWGK